MHVRVSNPPPKPLMIWDGECHFCRRWIERWREITTGKVEYVTYQEAANQFPEIPIDQFKRAVAFIEPDGKAFFAAEAVYRSLRYRSSRRWLAWSYDRVPGFAAVSELAYKFIARHRGAGSAVTRLLWGNDVRPPTYFWARRSFLRTLGVIYLIAFVSLWVQVDGLIGSDGISPIKQFLPAVQERARRPRLLAVADTLLVQFEQRISSFSLRRRCCFVVALNCRICPGGFADRAVCFLPVAYDRRTNFSKLSMGHSAAGDRLFGDISRAVATLAEARKGGTGLARRAVFAQAPPFQIDADVWRGEADQR